MTSIVRRVTAALVLALCSAACPARADEGTIMLTQASVPAAAKGADVALSMTVRNGGLDDDLIRARCSAANFSEEHTLDHGEGFPSMRPVKSIPIAGHGDTRLDADGAHVMLLQLARTLAAGDTFTCSITFRNAGRQDVAVEVHG